MVAAKTISIATVLKSDMQLQVPLFQRSYSWKREHWAALWEDVLQLVLDHRETPGERHFIGSVVLAPPPNRSAKARLVVDGQQRLLTISVLLCALHDEGTDLTSFVKQKIRNHLVSSSGRGPFGRLRILPTQKDQDAFSRIILGKDLDKNHQISSAYEYFKKRVRDLKLGDGESVKDPSAKELVVAVLDSLECVLVTASRDDNVHRIFESLNNKGQPLTQADLIRNYIFMRLSAQAEEFNQFTWQPLERRFSAEELTHLFWLGLVRDRPTVTQRQTYVEQQKKLHKMTVPALKSEIKRISDSGEYWERILKPEKEASKPVQVRLERLKAWQTTTVWPVLMCLLELRDDGTASNKEIAKAMQYLESYFVRRVVIGRATDNMNRVLLAAPQAIRSSDEKADDALRRFLSGEGKHWATDEELRSEGPSKAFYNHGKAFQKTLILSWLEHGMVGGEYEPADGFTVEHVMPQTLTKEWRAELKSGAKPGETVNYLHASLVNTLGNLTLASSERNSQLGNKSFEEKKAVLRKHGSGLELTKEITRKQNWHPDDIRKRSELMIERIIKTWPGPLD